MIDVQTEQCEAFHPAHPHIEPVVHHTPAESPMPADLQAGELAALEPPEHGALGHLQVLCDLLQGKELVHRNPSMLN